MSIDVLVAIDLAGGQVVRLTRGEMAAKTVYGDDPVATARRWEQSGARWLHVVDLDRATGTGLNNSETVAAIIESVGIPVQIGGGIRSVGEAASWVSRGAARVCAGTRSIDPEFVAEALAALGDRLVVSLDARKDSVAVEGWQQDTGRDPLALVSTVVAAGVKRLMFTDIDRDGTLSGPNLPAIEQVLETARVPVIASGGVNNAADVAALAGLKEKGLEGVVIGRAFYGGTLTLQDALAAAG